MNRGGKTLTGNKGSDGYDLSKIETYTDNPNLKLSKNDYRTIFDNGKIYFIDNFKPFIST